MSGLLNKEAMAKYYQEFTEETVRRWEQVAEANPKAEWNSNSIRDLLPFIKRVMPRVGRNQSLFGLSIISLEGIVESEREVVDYGLEPLLRAGVLDSTEVLRIASWYERTAPTWHSGDAEHFRKDFTVAGRGYSLATDSVRNYRDLNVII